jgi:hypothetical protein
MARFSFNYRRDLGTYLFGLWVVLFGLLSAPFLNLAYQPWAGTILGILLVISGIFHLIEL